MGARWLDPYIARWLSADTIVPQPGNPQDFNRYSYVGANPLKYIDPSGHADDAGEYEGGEEDIEFWLQFLRLLNWYYAEASEFWSLEEFIAAYHAGLEGAVRHHELAWGMAEALVGEDGSVEMLRGIILSVSDPDMWMAAYAQDSEFYLSVRMAFVTVCAVWPRAMSEVPEGEFTPFNFGNKAQIHWSGKQHGSPAHMGAILSKANKMAHSGQYTNIYINKRISTATGGLVQSAKQPDIIGVTPSGGYHIVEVVSPSQTVRQLASKCQSMRAAFGSLAVTYEVIP